MDLSITRTISVVVACFCGAIGCADAVFGADVGQGPAVRSASVQTADGWSFVFTSYGWIPWMNGNTVIKGRSFDVSVDPSDVFSHLDWSTLPAWMSYAEARRGRIGLFNDVVYASLSGSRGFDANRRNLDFSGNVSADYTQVTVEAGGAYEVWDGRNPVLSGSTALDVLAGARYWHQDAEISANTTITASPPEGLALENNRLVAKSGSIDWVDPFVGIRVRNQLGPHEELVVRADFGGFGAGSDFSWQVLATYNWQICTLYGHVLDGYIGYRALSVDYSQGSGTSRYEYDVLQQGPVIGSTLHF
jgi:hypothetical protein